jgi:hypothetical protein
MRESAAKKFKDAALNLWRSKTFFGSNDLAANSINTLGFGAPSPLRRVALALLIFFSWSNSAAAFMWPDPKCVSISELHPEFIARDKLPRDPKLPIRRNAEYFFGSVASPGSKLASAHVANFGSVSVFLPEKECPVGCTAYVVWAKKRALTAKPIYFVSHVITSVFPAYSWIFQGADGESFVMISSEQPEGVPTKVEELRILPPQFGLIPKVTKPCFLDGNFGKIEMPSNPDPK